MRDRQRLEELSSTAALGLWADDVVLALHRAVSAAGPSEADAALLREAADVLEAAQARTERPLSTPSGRALAATDTALSAVAAVARAPASAENGAGESADRLLARVSKALLAAAAGRLRATAEEDLEPLIAVFSTIGRSQLIESNSVLSSRKDAGAWTAMPKTSGS